MSDKDNSPLCICDQEDHHHECPRAEGLESIESIAERVFPEEVAEIRKSPVPHIDSDRLSGKTDWDRECQESRKLNRR